MPSRKRCLELFKGTGSVGSVCEELGYDVVSLDINPRYAATYCCDILNFDYKAFKPGYFTIIWASPECKIYSNLQFTNIGWKWRDKEHLEHVRLEHAKYVECVLKLIQYLTPKWWFIENPRHSAMKNLPCMHNLPYVDVDYCLFGTLHRKPTRIWTNRKDLYDALCTRKRHAYQIGMTSPRKMYHEVQRADPTNTEERYAIPEDLLRYLIS